MDDGMALGGTEGQGEPDEPGEPVQRGRDADDAPRSGGSGWGGCALWAAAFVLVIVGGCGVGLALRGDRSKGQQPLTVEAGNNWILQVHQDETDAPCTDLLDDDGKFLAGQCAFATDVDPGDPTATPRYKATSAQVGDQFVVFGPVPSGVASVRLTLADGSRPLVSTGENRGVHYFVKAVTSEDVGPTTLLDEKGDTVSPPAAE